MQKLDELDSQVAQIIKKLELEFGDVVTYKVSSNPSNGHTQEEGGEIERKREREEGGGRGMREQVLVPK